MRAEGAVGGQKDEEVHVAVGDGDPQQGELGEPCGEGAEEHGGEESGVVGAPAQREQTQSHGDRPAAGHKHPPPDFITSFQQGCTQNKLMLQYQMNENITNYARHSCDACMYILAKKKY